MASLMILLVWMALGIAVNMFLRQPGEPRFGWAPLAMAFGPMWALMVIEREEASRVLNLPVPAPVDE